MIASRVPAEARARLVLAFFAIEAAINSALQARDSEGARAAVAAHLNFVEIALVNERRADRNEAIARKRLDHETNR